MPKPTRTSARKSSLPAVSGTASVIHAVGTIGPEKNRTGEIEISGERGSKRYLIRISDTAYQLYSYDDKRQCVTHYDLPATLDTCDCPDFVSRSQRREDNLCKHCKAVAALVARGKLPTITPTCTPTVEVCDYDDEADHYDDALADAEAEAWHSQWDAA